MWIGRHWKVRMNKGDRLRKSRLPLFFFLMLLFSVSQGIAAINGTIQGIVADRESKEPLPGANVQILGTLRGASTNSEGMFVIKVPVGTYTLRVSMIGYRALRITDVHVQPNSTTKIAAPLRSTPIEFDPIVVLAGKIEQRLDQAPVSMSVVTSNEIKRRNPMDLVQALETTPGVHFIGNQINIRGSTGYTFGAGNKVQLLLDGVPVYASDTGEFNWDMLPPLDIEQIEVLKGAGSTLWGSSALGGVVNVITKDPSEDARLMFSSSVGKYDEPYYDEWKWTDHSRLHYTRNDLSYSQKTGNLGVRLSAGRYMDTGYSELGDAQKYNLTGKLDYRFANGIKWTGYAAYSHINRGFFVQWRGQNDPYEVDPQNLDNRAATNQLNAYTKVVVPFSARFAINMRASFVRTLMGNQFGPDAGFNPALGQGAELQANYIPVWGHILTMGVQYQHDAGSTEYFGDHKGYFIGPYIQDEWTALENLRITAGARYDRYQLIGGKAEDLFSPRLGINWQPWAGTTLRGSVGSGFRAATIVERFLELTIMNFKILANPDLKSESSWAYDIGFRHYITSNWNVDVSLFDNEYWNLIEAHLDLIRGQIQFRNISRARIRGVEATTNLSGEWSLFGLAITPSLQATMTAMQHRDLVWDEPLTYRPNVIANIKPSFTTGPWHVEADFRYASEIKEVKIYPINDRVPMKIVDVRGSYKWRNLTLQLSVNNLLQYNYAPMESNLMAPRNFVLSLKGEF